VTVPEPADGSDILNEDVVLRRIYHASPQNAVRYVVEDEVTHARRATSAAFAPDADGLSVYLERILLENGLGRLDMTTDPWNAVASLQVRVLRENSLGVIHDPWPPDVPDPDHPRHAAHCLATGWDRCKTNKEVHRIRKALALAATLVLDPGTQ
jgi:hypothetical protein